MNEFLTRLSAWLPALSDLKQWQPLVGAMVAAIGIIVAAMIAVINVNRQIRINILSREEDRIERNLPGLRDAASYLFRMSYFVDCADMKGASGLMKDWGYLLDDQKEVLELEIAKVLPHTDDSSRRAIVVVLRERLRQVYSYEFNVIDHKTKENNARPDERAKLREEIEKSDAVILQRFRASVAEIVKEIHVIGQKIEVFSCAKRSTPILKVVDTHARDDTGFALMNECDNPC
jgi:hypothetical protein